jgi:predicted TIM-barrel fold metal-dependent hydrolase
MTDDYLPPPEHATQPRRPPPPGAADCHAHIFGPFDRFPLMERRTYTPLELPGERFLKMLDEIGFTRGVLVQPSVYGTDCRAMLRSLALDPARLRGIAVISPEVTDSELAQMHAQGVRGARFSRPPAGMAVNTVDFDALQPLAPRLAALGWHAQVVAPCAHLVEVVPRLLAHGLPLVVDHFGLVDPSRGLNDESFQALLSLLGGGRIWLKLTPFRSSKRYPDYEDIEPFHRAVLAANPERLLWGSDWPHAHLKTDMPDAGQLVDLFDRWTANDPLRQQILVDNPASLYGF